MSVGRNPRSPSLTLSYRRRFSRISVKQCAISAPFAQREVVPRDPLSRAMLHFVAPAHGGRNKCGACTLLEMGGEMGGSKYAFMCRW